MVQDDQLFIPLAEFRDRQERATAETANRGLDALVVCSRGGGTADRYADVYYLANFYSSFPYVTDRRPDWSARAHAFVVLPANGKPALVVDMPVKESDCPVDDVVQGDDVVRSLIGVLRHRGLQNAKVGLCGADVLPFSVAAAIRAELPGLELVEAGDILSRMRAVKSPAEIAILRRSSALGSAAIEVMMDVARPGATHGEIMGRGLDLIAREGGILYNNFMTSGRGGNDPVMVSSDFPTWASREPLEEGQWFQIGISGVWRYYFFDHSRSKPIGHTTESEIEAFEAAIACVQAGVAAVRPGVTAGLVAEAALARLVQLGFSPKSDFSGLGHGLGLGWDTPWLVPGDPTVLEPGMVLCIERTVEKHGFVGDFEETVLVTDSGSELLSTATIRRW